MNGKLWFELVEINNRGMVLEELNEQYFENYDEQEQEAEV